MGDILIVVEHEEYEIQWACNTSISTDTGETDNPNKEMTSPKWTFVENIRDLWNKQFYVKKGMDSYQEKHGKIKI